MGEADSVAAVNGRTVTVRRWVAWLTLATLFLSLATSVFGNIIDPFIWKTEIENTVNQNTKRVDKVELWQETHVLETTTVNALYSRQLGELQLNLKVLMEKNGLKYQSITP